MLKVQLWVKLEKKFLFKINYFLIKNFIVLSHWKYHSLY